ENVKIASVPDLKPRKKRAKPSDRIRRKGNLTDSLQAEIPASRKVIKEKSYQGNRTKPKPSRSTIPFKSAGGSGLKLQAIAWSSDSKDRIAVVNGRILREGSSIEGVLIIKIDKNDVSFQKGSEQWKQKFGSQ
ncbi:MAG: general secretion pathway protein GspB, partial [Deltaproteobacteria bacterium]|nr:general secretion pathway protein GspB [Deltaproteobacteria bacterium]